MKKRKPPIVAITILLICGAVAVGFNYKSGINPKAQEAEAHAEPASEIKVGDPHPATSAAAVASQVKQQAGGAAASAAPKARQVSSMKGPGGKFGNGAPSIAIQKFGNQKPVPNDSSISSQWYDSTSAKSGQ